MQELEALGAMSCQMLLPGLTVLQSRTTTSSSGIVETAPGNTIPRVDGLERQVAVVGLSEASEPERLRVE